MISKFPSDSLVDLKVAFYKAFFSPDDLCDKLALAIESNHTQKVHALMKAGATLDRVAYNNSTPLTEAIWHGREDIVDDLLNAGANPNFCDSLKRSPLNCAITSYQLRRPENHEAFATPKIVYRLLKAGAAIDALDEYENNTLRQRIKMYGIDVLETLLQEWEAQKTPAVETPAPVAYSGIESGATVKVSRPLKLRKKVDAHTPC